jgi:hypothetical protein
MLQKDCQRNRLHRRAHAQIMWIGVVFLTSAFILYTYENRRLTDMLMENDEVISFLPGSEYCWRTS